MVIEIDQPELQALIMDRLQAGRFESVEQTLMDALKEAPPPKRAAPYSGPTGMEIIAAFQRCPDPDFTLDRDTYSFPMPVRELEF